MTRLEPNKFPRIPKIDDDIHDWVNFIKDIVDWRGKIQEWLNNVVKLPMTKDADMVDYQWGCKRMARDMLKCLETEK